jgi:hypothetical protein
VTREEQLESSWKSAMAELMKHPDWEVDPYGCLANTVKHAVAKALEHKGEIGQGLEWELTQKLDELTKGA